MDRKGLPSAAELAELRPAHCAAGSLKRLPRSLKHRLFGACARGTHAKPVAEVLRWPNRSRAPLHAAEHAAACAVCEGCIEWAPSARPTAQQLVALAADAVLSIPMVAGSEPVWVHEAWRRCKNEAKAATGTASLSISMTPASPGSPASVTATYSPPKRVVIAQPCTPRSNDYADSPIKYSPVSALTPSFEQDQPPMTRGRSLLRAASALAATADDEFPIGFTDHAEAAPRKLVEAADNSYHDLTAEDKLVLATKLLLQQDCASPAVNAETTQAAADDSRPRGDSDAVTEQAERIFGSTPLTPGIDLKREIYELYYAEKSPRSSRSDLSDAEITDSAVTVPMLGPEDALPVVALKSEALDPSVHFPSVGAGASRPFF